MFYRLQSVLDKRGAALKKSSSVGCCLLLLNYDLGLVYT
mgnify:CR=1 FL=1